MLYVDDYIKIYKDTTLAINKCIIDASKVLKKVVFTKNTTYISGLIYLKDNTHLYFEDNSMLKMTDDIDSFNINSNNKEINLVTVGTYDNCDYSGLPTKYFIYGCDIKNITISGSGIIDGNEEIFYGKVTKWHIDGYFYPRVPLIFLENVNNLTIKDITLQNSAFWTVHLVGCNQCLIDSININNNLRLANCDGIDPDHSKNIIIRNCNIKSADDCIVFKTTSNFKKYGSLENVLVENCTLTSTSAALKFGSESTGEFKNIKVINTKIINSNRGISLMMRDEGVIHDCYFANIDIKTRLFSPLYWWGKSEGIAITCVRRNENTKLGSIFNINFDNINIESEQGILIYSENESISNINLNDITLNLKSKTDYPKDKIDIRPNINNTIIDHKLTPLYINKALDVSFNNFKINVDCNILSLYNDEYIVIDSKNIKINE